MKPEDWVYMAPKTAIEIEIEKAMDAYRELPRDIARYGAKADVWAKVIDMSSATDTGYRGDYYLQSPPPTATSYSGLMKLMYPIISKPVPRKGVKWMNLYEVTMVYGEDRKNPVINEAKVVADTTDDAKVKSGIMKLIMPEWDMDFVTFLVKTLGEVAVKERPTEVKTV